MLETKADLENQDRIISALCEAWNVKSKRLGDYSPFDYYLYRDTILKCIVEVKCRSMKSISSYSGIYLDLDKYLKLVHFTNLTDIPALFVAEYQEGIFYIEAKKVQSNFKQFNIVVAGRSDRPNVQNDVRPALVIPMDYFKMI